VGMFSEGFRFASVFSQFAFRLLFLLLDLIYDCPATSLLPFSVARICSSACWDGREKKGMGVESQGRRGRR